MEAFAQSLGLVFVSEMGDKTQLLALVLAMRFKKPWTIMAGILVATIANHGMATWAGGWLASQVSPETLKFALAFSFVAFGVWVLFPDTIEDDAVSETETKNVFLTTAVLFFLAEMGDKTQLATLVLGARFQMPIAVILGTTSGMLIADGLAVAFGERMTRVIPLKVVRMVSSLLFFVSAAVVLF